MRKSVWTSVGGAFAAFLGSICCIGPVLFVSLGLSAGFVTAFQPLRPLFGFVMLVLFGVAFYSVYGVKGRAHAQGTMQSEQACERPNRRRDAVLLWTALGIALIVWTFPTWSLILL